MSNVYKIRALGGLSIPVLSSDPVSPENGTIWYNSSDDKFRSREGGVTSELGSRSEFGDDVFRIIDDSDGTKKVAFSVGALSTATTRIISVPDADVDLADVNTAVQRDGSVAFTADQSMGGFKLTNLASPVAATDAASKGYVDAVQSGLDVKQSVRLATVAALPANTPAGSGVGKTLTADANGALSVDGVAVAASDRVLVKDEGDLQDNGIYVVTQAGSGGAPFILTRATDFDSNTEVTAGAFTFVASGTVNAGTGWVLTTEDPITLETSGLIFSQFSSSAQLQAGEGLVLNGQDLDVNAGNGIEIVADAVVVKRDAVGGANLAAAIDVNSNGVAVRVDDVTIEEGASGRLQVMDAGITNAKVATGIDAAKIADGSVSNAEFQRLDGVTSGIQGQLDAKASTALSNLASVAINTSLVSDTDNTDDLGSQAINWKDVHAKSLRSTNGVLVDSDSDAVGDRASDLTLVQKAVKRGKQSSALIEEEYVDASTLANNTTAVVAAFTFAHASYVGLEVQYVIREATSLDTRIGSLLVSTDGTVASVSDVFSETADVGVSWSAAVSGANVELTYTSANSGNARTMRADLKRFRA